jgi:hypothetical protein
MIIRIKGANYTYNIGALDTYFVKVDWMGGLTPTGTSVVKKNAKYEQTFTIKEGWFLQKQELKIEMGDTDITANSGVVTISGKTVTIVIGEVTGNVHIRIPTAAELNLAGATWTGDENMQANSTIAWPFKHRQIHGDSVVEEGEWADVKFVDANRVKYVGMLWESFTPDRDESSFDYFIYKDASGKEEVAFSIEYPTTSESVYSWHDESYRTITFKGGNDLTVLSPWFKEYGALSGGGEEEPDTITWYINATNDGTRSLEASSGGTGPYYYHKNSSYAGKTINAVRFKAPQAGTVEYGKVVSGAYTNIGSITVTTADTFEIYTIPDLTLQSNEYIAFKGYFNYSQATDSPEATWFCSLPNSENKMNLGIDIGYVVGGGGTSEPTSTTWYLEAVDGFTLNSTCGANGAEKYYYQLNTAYVNKPINAIKLDAATAGTFEYGVKDGTTYTSKGTASASSTGVVIINIPEFTITSNQLFWIQTKTGAFKFGTADLADSNLYFNGSNGSNNKMNLGISLGYIV